MKDKREMEYRKMKKSGNGTVGHTDKQTGGAANKNIQRQSFIFGYCVMYFISGVSNPNHGSGVLVQTGNMSSDLECVNRESRLMSAEFVLG
jgi:hypothetical protein